MPASTQGRRKGKPKTAAPSSRADVAIAPSAQARIAALEAELKESRHQLSELTRQSLSLRQQVADLRALYDSASAGLVVHDGNGDIIEANDAACATLGIKLDQLRGLNTLDPRWNAVREDGSPFPSEQLPGVIAHRTGTKVSDVIVGVPHAINGDTRWLLITAAPVLDGSRTVGVVTTFVDITDRKLAEDQRAVAENAIRETKEQLLLVLEAGFLGFWDWHIPSGTTRFGGEWAAMLGYELHEIEHSYRCWESFVHPDDRASTLRALQDHLDGHTSFFENEHRLRHRDGSWRWILDRGRVVERAPDGSPVRAIGTHADVTERKQFLTALTASNEKLAEALAVTDIATWEWDLQTNRITGCPKFTEIFGDPETGEIEFEKGLKRIHDQDRDICRRAVEQVIAEGSPFSHHSRIFNRSNQTRWFASRGKLSQSPSGERRVIGTLHDITELKQAEAILQSANVELEARVAERTRQLVTAFEDLSTEMSRRRSLEAELTEISEREQSRLGQDLHDGLGQELTGIALLCITHAQLLARENHPSADRAAELADAIASTIEVARNLAKGFYPVELQRYGLVTAIKDLLLQARKRSTITYELCLPPRFQRLPENVEIHLYRILQECLTNAAKHGGASRIRISLETDHEGCILAVEDNGCGFDTSIPRSGMGLHLIDYRSRIIGAEARIQSTPGKGCIIQCVVPASSSKRAAESHGTTPP